jgi:hypothetical protein
VAVQAGEARDEGVAREAAEAGIQARERPHRIPVERARGREGFADLLLHLLL